MSIPGFLKEGVRVLMLIDRGAANSNKGSKRWVNKIITTNPLEFDQAYTKLIALQEYLGDKDIRLYSCVNPRNLDKAIKHFKHRQIDVKDENQEEKFYIRINESFCSSLMKPENKVSTSFLIDWDYSDKSSVENFCEQNKINIHYKYKTVNGWHYIVEPFDIRLMEGADVHRDGLLLLNWLEN